jgi:type IV pilus assembly protein PilA
MRAFTRYGKRGFTLVELMIVVAIIGVLAALAIYGVRRYLASSKTAEAKNNIGAIARGAVAAYERETYSNQLLPDGQTSSTFMHQLCAAAAWTPAAVPAGKKYQPNTTDGQDFNAGDNTGGWKCLKFALNEPIYYQYTYLTTPAFATISGAVDFEVAAQGDLDNNTKFSTFARGGAIRNGQVVLSTEIAIQNEYE